MKTKWLEGWAVSAAILGLLGCAGPGEKQGLLRTRAEGGARLYFLEGEEKSTLRIEQTVTLRSGDVSVGMIPTARWAVEEQVTVEDTFDRLVFSRPQDDEVLEWYQPVADRAGCALVRYSWEEPPGEVTATRLATVEYARRHGPISSCTPFPNSHWPDAVKGYLKLAQMPDDDDPIVKERAEEITGGATSQLEAVFKVFRWVKENIHGHCPDDLYDGYPNYECGNAAWMLRNEMAGACVDFACLNVALLRNLNIPARDVNVQVCEAIEDGTGHAGVQVYFQDLGWVSFDPVLTTHVFSDAILKGELRGTGHSTDTSMQIESEPRFQQNTITVEPEEGRPNLLVFYLEVNEPDTYHIDVEVTGLESAPERLRLPEKWELFPDTVSVSGVRGLTYAVGLFWQPTGYSHTFHISVREDPEQTLTLECRPVRPFAKSPYVLDAKVDPVLGDKGITKFHFESKLLWDLAFGIPSPTDIELVRFAPDGEEKTFPVTNTSLGMDEFALKRGVTFGAQTGILRFAFRGEADGREIRGETGPHAGPEVIPPPSELGDRSVDTGESVMPLIEKKLSVEVSGTPSSPSVKTTVTNTENVLITNLVVTLSAVHLGENRSLGIFRKNFGLVLPGQSKSVDWAPKIPAGTKPDALKIRAAAYAIQEIGKGRSKRAIGFREITFGEPSSGPGGLPADPAGAPLEKGKSLRQQFL